MCSCRSCRRVFARRASNGGFLTWIWVRRSDRSHLLRTFWKTTSFLYQVLTVHSFKNPSSIVWLNTQKKCKCYDTKNNVEKPHDSLGGEANRLGDVIDLICGWYAYVEEMVLFIIYMHAYPMVSLGLFIIWFVWRVRFLTIRFCHEGTRNWMVIKEKLSLNYLNGKV